MIKRYNLYSNNNKIIVNKLLMFNNILIFNNYNKLTQKQNLKLCLLAQLISYLSLELNIKNIFCLIGKVSLCLILN